MPVFNLQSPRDMFHKAARELERLNAAHSADHLFNFFLSAHHIQDYVRRSSAVPQHDLDTFLADDDMQFCRALCNSGKHVTLNYAPSPQTHHIGGALNSAPLNTTPLNAEYGWTATFDGRTEDLHYLPRRVLEKWDQFLRAHGL